MLTGALEGVKFLMLTQKAWHRENLHASQLSGSRAVAVSPSTLWSTAGQPGHNWEQRKDPHSNLTEIQVCFIEIESGSIFNGNL